MVGGSEVREEKGLFSPASKAEDFGISTFHAVFEKVHQGVFHFVPGDDHFSSGRPDFDGQTPGRRQDADGLGLALHTEGAADDGLFIAPRLGLHVAAPLVESLNVLSTRSVFPRDGCGQS